MDVGWSSGDACLHMTIRGIQNWLRSDYLRDTREAFKTSGNSGGILRHRSSPGREQCRSLPSSSWNAGTAWGAKAYVAGDYRRRIRSAVTALWENPDAAGALAVKA